MITAEQELTKIIGEDWNENINYGVISYFDSLNGITHRYRIPSIRQDSSIEEVKQALSNIKDSVFIESLKGFIVLKNGNWLERIDHYPDCKWKIHSVPSESQISHRPSSRTIRIKTYV